MSDVKAKKMTATGAAGVGPARVKAISYLPVAGGTIQVRDGGATGTVVLEFDVSASSNGMLIVPENGVRCAGDPYVTLTAVTSMTLIYG